MSGGVSIEHRSRAGGSGSRFGAKGEDGNCHFAICVSAICHGHGMARLGGQSSALVPHLHAVRAYRRPGGRQAEEQRNVPVPALGPRTAEAHGYYCCCWHCRCWTSRWMMTRPWWEEVCISGRMETGGEEDGSDGRCSVWLQLRCRREGKRAPTDTLECTGASSSVCSPVMISVGVS
jgi:hypothetical protein